MKDNHNNLNQNLKKPICIMQADNFIKVENGIYQIGNYNWLKLFMSQNFCSRKTLSIQKIDLAYANPCSGLFSIQIWSIIFFPYYYPRYCYFFSFFPNILLKNCTMIAKTI